MFCRLYPRAAKEAEANQQYQGVRRAIEGDVARANRAWGGYFDLHQDDLQEALSEAREGFDEADRICAQFVYVAHASEYRTVVPEPTALEPVLASLREAVIKQYGEHTRAVVQSLEAHQMAAAWDDQRPPQAPETATRAPVNVGSEAGDFVRPSGHPLQGVAEGGMPDPVPLSGLVANDPRNCLSDSARWRISEAYGKDELIRAGALADLEMRFKSEADPNRTFLEYCDSGSAAVELNRAKLDGARSILSAVLGEFRAFGMPVPALAHAMEDELDGLAYSAGLTKIEQQLLWKELDIYRLTVPAVSIPEAIRERIRVGLVRIDSKRLKRTKLDCLWETYDLHASEFAKAGERLTDALITEIIPACAFRAAIDKRWIAYPLIRRTAGVVEDSLDAWDDPSQYEVVPHEELTETFGGLRVTKGYEGWFKRNLESRVAYWRAEALAHAAGESTNDEPVIDAVPKPAAERTVRPRLATEVSGDRKAGEPNGGRANAPSCAREPTPPRRTPDLRSSLERKSGDPARLSACPPQGITEGAIQMPSLQQTATAVFGTNRPVTVVRNAGTAAELQWDALVGGDFVEQLLFHTQDQVKTADEVHCELFDEPRVIFRVDANLVHGGMTHWKARIMPRSEWNRLHPALRPASRGRVDPESLGSRDPDGAPGEVSPPFDPSGRGALSAIDSAAAQRPIPGASLDFASGEGRSSAVAAYKERWTCSEAGLARTARVDPADLSKWKKGLLPAASDKKSRIENALKKNDPPTPATKRSVDF